MPSQSKADGFVAHYAIVEDGGITVIEIWDSIDQHHAWFNEVVKPHLPPDTPETKFAELHNSNAKQQIGARNPAAWAIYPQHAVLPPVTAYIEA